jgi:hypothetical protein
VKKNQYDMKQFSLAEFHKILLTKTGWIALGWAGFGMWVIASQLIHSINISI